jgi:hypothetical protein
MYISARIKGSAIADAVKVPSKWLSEGNSVFIKNGEGLQRKQVEIVRNENDFVVVRGLEQGMFILAQEKAEI